MKKFYIAPPVDEVALEQEVLSSYSWLRDRVPSREDLRKIQNDHGIDHATMALYLSVMKSARYSPFIEAIRSQRISQQGEALPGLKVGLLPAMFHEEHPEVGGGGAHIIAAAKAVGFDAERLPTISKGGVIQNAEILKKWLEAQTSNRIMLITMSKGSLEFRYCWTYLMTDAEKAKIRFWLNFSGFPNGNGLAETLLASKWLRWRSILTAYIIGLSPKSFIESDPNFPAWKKPWDLRPDIKVFSFFPIPLTSHVQTSLIRRYLKLRWLGPNDGMSDFLDLCQAIS